MSNRARGGDRVEVERLTQYNDRLNEAVQTRVAQLDRAESDRDQGWSVAQAERERADLAEEVAEKRRLSNINAEAEVERLRTERDELEASNAAWRLSDQQWVARVAALTEANENLQRDLVTLIRHHDERCCTATSHPFALLRASNRALLVGGTETP